MTSQFPSAQTAVPNSSRSLDEFRFDWAVLPAVTESLPGTGGTIRRCLDDFVVSELSRFPPSGQGEFAYAYVEKRGLNTHDLVAALREHGVLYDEVGVAGLKDKYAITRQWLSVPAAHARCFDALDEMDGVRVLQTSRHDRRLRRGHLSGNRFEVRVRDPEDGWQGRAERIAERLSIAGLPNYFGPQRFGRFNSNAIDAVRLIRGEKVPGGRRLNNFFISALQAHLFNWNLKRRIESGVFGQVLAGDRARRHDSGGMFIVGDAEAESARARRLEISALLPLYGRKVSGGLDEAAAMEEKTLGQFGLRRSDFRRITRGDWRISRALPEHLSIRACDDGYMAEFTLPKGSYATTLLRELTKCVADATTVSVETGRDAN